jgi:signal transduction histidine kinase
MQRERRRALIRERLSRVTSHEMRSPLTIAVGYVDHLLRGEHDAERREDLLVVRDELGRLTRGSDRLLRLMQLQDQTDVRDVDLDGLLRDTAERWAAVADREWAVDCEVATFRCSPERIRACLDTLIENSLRYTEAGDAVRVVAFQLGEDVVVGVADSGPGLDPQVSAALNRGDGTDSLLRDPRSQTGLGLSLVREVAGAHGGRLLTASGQLASVLATPPVDVTAIPAMPVIEVVPPASTVTADANCGSNPGPTVATRTTLPATDAFHTAFRTDVVSGRSPFLAAVLFSMSTPQLVVGPRAPRRRPRFRSLGPTSLQRT